MQMKTSSVLVLCLMLGACASTSGRKAAHPRDPIEPLNRAVFKVNDKLDRAVAKPLAKAYVRVVPRPARTGVTNFMENLRQPAVMVNDLLQGKWRPAANDAGRFILNTTLGLGGIFDPASAAGLDRNDEDFGQTLGKWGVPSGPYLMLPLLGPSTLRDFIGQAADEFADPRLYIEDDSVRWSLWGIGLMDRRARLLDIEGALQQAYDPYAVLRSVYLQRREYQVQDGEVPMDEEELLEDPELEAAEAEAEAVMKEEAAEQAAAEDEAPATDPQPPPPDAER
jgi:phospholipid-binding lipoprotein MlaA